MLSQGIPEHSKGASLLRRGVEMSVSNQALKKEMNYNLLTLGQSPRDEVDIRVLPQIMIIIFRVDLLENS